MGWYLALLLALGVAYSIYSFIRDITMWVDEEEENGM